MNKDIKAEWIKALLSGDYGQGESCLRQDNKFCCLGVLCDIHAKSDCADEDWKPDNYEDHMYYLGQSLSLPNEVRLWAGLTQSNPTFSNIGMPHPYDDLAALNDNGYTFEEIAKVIEAKF